MPRNNRNPACEAGMATAVVRLLLLGQMSCVLPNGEQAFAHSRPANACLLVLRWHDIEAQCSPKSIAGAGRRDVLFRGLRFVYSDRHGPRCREWSAKGLSAEWSRIGGWGVRMLHDSSLACLGSQWQIRLIGRKQQQRSQRKTNPTDLVM